MLWSEAKFGRPKIAVVGDIMLDHYMFCEAMGLTPEDPIAPKLKLIEEKYALGGAANVARNLAHLGAGVTVLGTRGSDVGGEILAALLQSDSINTVTPLQGCTTTKQRLIAYPKDRVSRSVVHPEGRYICRIDSEDCTPVEGEALADIAVHLRNTNYDMYVVSDYAKGVIVQAVMDELEGKPYVVDPKRMLEWYGDALVLTPNEAEAKKFCHQNYHGRAKLITKSGKGATLTCRADETVDYTVEKLMGFDYGYCHLRKQYSIPVHYRTSGDATGCGDSVVAGLAFALANGLGLKDSATFAIACGAKAIDREGVNPVELYEVLIELEEEEYQDENQDLAAS